MTIPLLIFGTTFKPAYRLMAMKKIAAFLSIVIFSFSCKNGNNTPDVSHIKIDLTLERFEKSFFSIDTNNLSSGLQKVRSEFPDFYPDFMQNILGISGSPNDTSTLSVSKKFLSSYYSFEKELEKKFSNTTGIVTAIKQDFRFVKYYFPDYRIPGLATFMGPLDAPGVALTRNRIAI